MIYILSTGLLLAVTLAFFCLLVAVGYKQTIREQRRAIATLEASVRQYETRLAVERWQELFDKITIK